MVFKLCSERIQSMTKVIMGRVSNMYYSNNQESGQVNFVDFY